MSKDLSMGSEELQSMIESLEQQSVGGDTVLQVDGANDSLQQQQQQQQQAASRKRKPSSDR